MMLTMTVETILMDAKADNRKGNYGVYEWYKQKLGLVCSSSEEYQEACRSVAKALKI